MKIIEIGSSEVIMSNPQSKHNYFAWPSAVRAKNGKIIVGASGFRLGHVCPFGKTVISYSEDEGKTFTIPAPVFDTVLDDRDCGLCVFGENGLIVTSFNNTVEMQRSSNKSSTDHPTKIAYIDAYLDTVTPEEQNEALGSVFRISNDNGVTFGKIYKSPVTSPHGPIELHDGTILWVGTTFFVDDKDNSSRIRAYKINPEDGSMEFVSEIDPIIYDGKEDMSCEPYAIELDDGTLICHIRVESSNRTHYTTYQSESKDGGKTWSKPRQILSDLGGAPAHLIKHSTGVLISVYGYRAEPFGIRAAFSFDGGKTWDIDNIVYDKGIEWDMGYPASVELSDGSLMTVFYTHLEKGKPAVIVEQKWSFEK